VMSALSSSNTSVQRLYDASRYRFPCVVLASRSLMYCLKLRSLNVLCSDISAGVVPLVTQRGMSRIRASWTSLVGMSRLVSCG
jgi:hypothetical protein